MGTMPTTNRHTDAERVARAGTTLAPWGPTNRVAMIRTDQGRTRSFGKRWVTIEQFGD
jgi:hypothetical protein